MNISDYSSYFHDGSLIDVVHNNSNIILSIESAEIDSEENKDDIPLSKHSTIKGNLHLESVGKIIENDEQFTGSLRMLHDSAGILHLKIRGNCIHLGLDWVNYPPHPDVTAYSFYNIEVGEIWWENIPDLFDPFW